MRLTASDFYKLHRPSRCKLRIYLDTSDVQPSPPSPYQEVLLTLGGRHERAHLETLGPFKDLRMGDYAEREENTRAAIDERAAVLYQPFFRVETKLNDRQCEIIGEPDFLIREGEGYVVRDAKLSRRITEKDHPEILRQLELYGWLFEQTTDQQPIRLEVFSGTSEIVSLGYDGGDAALMEVTDIMNLKAAHSAPFSPVGWSKCIGCGYRDHCWPNAEQRRDIALVYGVDQALALTLRDNGIASYDDLVENHTETTLAEVARPWGAGFRRVGKSAERIMPMARALASDTETIIATPKVPESANYVMFDLEGLPPHLNELQKIYLWGIRVYGQQPSEFLPALSGFGQNGDREGWESFLCNVSQVFSDYGDIPFVHWHNYEATNLKMYVDRYGDKDGHADRVKENLVDLLPIVQRSVALPISSYSLKVVEQYIGYKRTQDEYGGDWAMAKFIEATETDDEDLRERVMNAILDYNREDLEATWAVLTWIKTKIA